jgi:hypothetical protein
VKSGVRMVHVNVPCCSRKALGGVVFQVNSPRSILTYGLKILIAYSASMHPPLKHALTNQLGIVDMAIWDNP